MNKEKAEYRIKIFQDIKALVGISRNLGVVLDRNIMEYGDSMRGKLDDNNPYTGELVRIVQEIKQKLLSEAGAQFTPRGLYRNLLDFKDKCVEYMKWHQGVYVGESMYDDDSNYWIYLETELRKRFKRDSENFQNDCDSILQKLLIYENERVDSEESFFGV